MIIEQIVLCVVVVGFFILLVKAFAPAETATISSRLEVLKKSSESSGKSSIRDADEMNKSFIVRVVLPLADKCSKFIPTPQATLDKCRRTITAAGLLGKVTEVQICTLSYMLMIGLPIFFYILTAAKERTTSDWFIIGISCVLGYRVPFGFVQGKAAKRRSQIQRALPFTLDLISISVEAGVAFDGALAIVAEKTTGPLTDEINLTLREIRLGKGRNDALASMAERVGVDDLRSFLTAVCYIARLGGSLVDVIRIQADAMRVKRRQRAEEKAMKTPVKIMIPLVLFIFPSMFIVILGPAGISVINKMNNTSQLGGTPQPDNQPAK